MMFTILALLMVDNLEMGNCYPPGAIVTACPDMFPVHDNHKSKNISEAPYTITPSSDRYRKGQTITITIDSDVETTFKGVMLQARMKGSDTPIGKWTLADEDLGYQYMTCGNPLGAITHTNSLDKKLPIYFQWNAPVQGKFDDVIFYATMLRHFDEFWVMIPSKKPSVYTASSAMSTAKYSPIVLLLLLINIVYLYR